MAPPQPTIVYNTVYNSGAASSATISSGTPVHRNLDATNTSCPPNNSSLAPLCREHPSDGTDQSATEMCFYDGRGLVKNLSRRLARKLQRSASLVNALLSKQIQSVLDAADVDRCDVVEICCSDAPCLTEAMQQRGLSSFSLLRSDGVGNIDAQTREKLFGWFSEKRPQKAWFSPPAIAHQNISTRCSLRSRQIFRQVFEFAAAVQFGGHICWDGLQNVPAGLPSSSVILELSRKVVVENCSCTGCDSCFAKST